LMRQSSVIRTNASVAWQDPSGYAKIKYRKLPN
jgi:hypothetical protein